MGGEDTEIGDATTDVLLEAANFEPVGIFRSSERLRLRTEGSNRWEKGVDPHLAPHAADLCTRLILDLAGATWVGGHRRARASLPERPVVRFRPRARRRGDRHRDRRPPTQHALLGRLGFDVARRAASLSPTWRARDVTREIDVVEEVARFRLDDVPFTLPRAPRDVRRARPASQRLRRRVEDVLAGLGFAETYTPSLRPDDDTPWKLPEPITVELTALRTQLLPSLVEAARRNAEAGRRADRAVRDRARLPARRTATCPTSGCASPGIAEGVVRRTRRASSRRSTRRSRPSRRSSAAERRAVPPRQDRAHRRRARRRAAPGRARRASGARSSSTSSALFAASREPVTYEDVITYPAIRQDLAFAVDEAVTAGELVAAAPRGGGPGAARDAPLRRLPRLAGRARDGSRSPSASRSSRPSGR